jgi:hypothetical protein
VDLEGHAGAEVAARDLGVDADHGQLDEVGGGALQGRVDGGALGEASLIGVARRDVWDGADSTKIRADGLVAADGFQRAVDEAADSGVTGKVGLYILLRNALVDAELRGQAEGRDAVDDAEVDGLGAGARLLVELGDGDAEDLGGGEGVDVLYADRRSGSCEKWAMRRSSICE